MYRNTRTPPLHMFFTRTYYIIIYGYMSRWIFISVYNSHFFNVLYKSRSRILWNITTYERRTSPSASPGPWISSPFSSCLSSPSPLQTSKMSPFGQYPCFFLPMPKIPSDFGHWECLFLFYTQNLKTFWIFPRKNKDFWVLAKKSGLYTQSRHQNPLC